MLFSLTFPNRKYFCNPLLRTNITSLINCLKTRNFKENKSLAYQRRHPHHQIPKTSSLEVKLSKVWPHWLRLHEYPNWNYKGKPVKNMYNTDILQIYTLFQTCTQTYKGCQNSVPPRGDSWVTLNRVLSDLRNFSAIIKQCEAQIHTPNTAKPRIHSLHGESVRWNI